MSFTGVFGLVILVIVAIALLGPNKLPQGIEQLWLMLTNFRRSQSELPPLTLEQAQRMWQASENPLYDLIQIMYGAVEHLVELRRRIFVVVGTLLACTIVGFAVANPVLGVLTKPAGGVPMVVLRPIDMVWSYIEIALSLAVAITLPVLIYQALMFIRPALETEEEIKIFRRAAIMGVPLVLLFFVLGLCFAYFVMLPFMLPYLASFGTNLATATWNIKEYLTFVLTVMLWIGLAFQTPLIMALLSRLGLVTPQAMARQWRFALVGISLLAAIITPTVDPFNMAVVMVPLLVLYFLGVLLARLVHRPRLGASLQETGG